MVNPAIGDPTPAQTKAMFPTTGTARLPRTVKVALAALDTAGGILAWLNPENVAILVTRIVLDVTTKSTAACTADFGQAANGTTTADNLIDGVDVGTATGVFDNTKDIGTNGKGARKVAAGEYVTGSKATGAAAGLVGSAYITYTPA